MLFRCAYTKLVNLRDLKPNPKNPNTHPPQQIAMLAKIIAYQGQRAPIVVSKRSGFITKGHGRLEALKLLGWQQAAVDYQEYSDSAQEYADIVADNQIAELSSIDQGILGDLLSTDLKDIEIDVLGIEDPIKVEDLDDIKALEDKSSTPSLTFKITCASVEELNRLKNLAQTTEGKISFKDFYDAIKVELA